MTLGASATNSSTLSEGCNLAFPASAGEQAHRGAVAAHDQPIAVVLDLMHPAWSSRRLGSTGRNAGVKRREGRGALAFRWYRCSPSNGGVVALLIWAAGASGRSFRLGINRMHQQTCHHDTTQSDNLAPRPARSGAPAVAALARQSPDLRRRAAGAIGPRLNL